MAVSQALAEVLKVLTEHKLVDDTGHVWDCGYTDETPVCNCEKLGQDIYKAIQIGIVAG